MNYLRLLRNQIDITREPFSDRGSRLLVFKQADSPNLYVRLAERLIHVEPGLESYLGRPPFISDLCFLDENGMALDYALTTGAELLQFQTRIGRFKLAFQDGESLAIGLPAGRFCGLRLRLRSELLCQSDSGGAIKHVRNLAYTTNGSIVRNQVTATQDGYQVELLVLAQADSSILLSISDDNESRLVPPFSETSKKALERWQAWFRKVPPVDARYSQKYAYAWWVMANNLVVPKGYIGYEAMMPTKAFYLGIWLWDSALHALALRHINPELARNQLRVMLAHQLPDGMLPDAIFDEGVVAEIDHPIHARVTKPPILAWAAIKIHETCPDLGFIAEIYPALARWNAWWFSQNDDDADGLVQYTHPYSSGLDNSPLWDHGLPVESPDINTYLHLQMKALGTMAVLLGRPDEAEMWRRRASALLRRMITDQWDEDLGVFRALHDEKPIPVMTPFNLFPLWSGELPAEMVKRLVAHLHDPACFGGERMLPTVARNDPAYDPERMWRGPIWANINYFFVEALRQAGELELSRSLRRKTLDLILQQPGIFEYYNPDTGKPPATAAAMFGWTAAVFIELAIQESAEAGSSGV